MLSALSDGVTYDVIHSSFVLHHLATEDKAEFFRRAARALAPGGVLLLVDTMREENETREDYLKHYFDWIEKDWTGLSRAEKDAIYEHVSTSDSAGAIVRFWTAGARGGARSAWPATSQASLASSHALRASLAMSKRRLQPHESRTRRARSLTPIASSRRRRGD